jgi:hypothetical protein
VHDRLGRRDVGVRGGHDLRPRFELERAERERQRVRPAADADGVPDAAVGRELGLEGRHRLAEDERRTLDDPIDRGAQAFADRVVVRVEIDEGDLRRN